MSDKEKDVELTKIAGDIIKTAGRRELRNRFEEYEKKPARVFGISPAVLSVVATVLVLFSIGLWLFLGKESASHEELFVQNFETFQTPIALRSSTDSTQNYWSKAIDAYAVNDFETALTFFLHVEDSKNPEQSTIPPYLSSFYIGICHLTQDDAGAEKAKLAFQEVLASDNDYHEAARWYLGLAALKLGEENEARNIFEEIVEQQTDKSDQAANILETLGH